MGTMLDIGARNIFNSDHDMFREQVRRWMRERLAPLQSSFEEEYFKAFDVLREDGNWFIGEMPWVFADFMTKQEFLKLIVFIL